MERVTSTQGLSRKVVENLVMWEQNRQKRKMTGWPMACYVWLQTPPRLSETIMGCVMVFELLYNSVSSRKPKVMQRIPVHKEANEFCLVDWFLLTDLIHDPGCLCMCWLSGCFLELVFDTLLVPSLINDLSKNFDTCLYSCKCHFFYLWKKMIFYDHPKMEACHLGLSRNTRGGVAGVHGWRRSEKWWGVAQVLEVLAFTVSEMREAHILSVEFHFGFFALNNC